MSSDAESEARKANHESAGIPLADAADTTKEKPEWQQNAEMDARRVVKGRVGGSNFTKAEEVFANAMKLEFHQESASNVKRIESKLESLLKRLDDAKRMKDVMTFNETRLAAIHVRNDIIAQREAAGLTQNNTAVCEETWPIPRQAMRPGGF